MDIREDITFHGIDGVGKMVDALLLAHIHDRIDLDIRFDGSTVRLKADVSLGDAWEVIRKRREEIC